MTSQSALLEEPPFQLQEKEGRALHESLSDREYQVLCMLATGKTNTEISKLLSLHINTISTYRVRIYKKMGVRSTAELTAYALLHNLVKIRL